MYLTIYFILLNILNNLSHVNQENFERNSHKTFFLKVVVYGEGGVKVNCKAASRGSGRCRWSKAA